MEDPKDLTIEMLENQNRELAEKKARETFKEELQRFNGGICKEALEEIEKGTHVKEGYEEFLMENYPLKITRVSANNDQCIITMGSEMVVPLVFDNDYIAKKYIERKPMGLIFGMIATIVEASKRINKKNK